MPPFLWTQKDDIGPRPRASSAMSFDPSRERLILFGGDAAATLLRDTWEWDGDHWTQVADSGPSARRGFAMAYDVARNRVVLFGGESGATKFGDTWEWDGALWTQVSDTGPGARTEHAMVYDSVGNRAILFGGKTGAGLAGDTWQWQAGEWTEIEDIGPSARSGHSMAFDPNRGRVVLFGGARNDGKGLSDTWEWDGSVWTEESDFGPDPCVNAAMVFAGRAVVLFGGVDSVDKSTVPSSHKVYDNTWAWDGRHWTQVQDMGPKARWRHAMAFDSMKGEIILFGGLSAFAPDGDPSLVSSLLSDTWAHPETTVGIPPIEPPPEPTPSIVSIGLEPASLKSTGDVTTATVTLSGPAPTSGLIIQVWAYDRTEATVSPEALLLPSSFAVAGGTVTPQFQVTRGAAVLDPGTYLVGVRIEGTIEIPEAELLIG
jgi:hypothetical protein